MEQEGVIILETFSTRLEAEMAAGVLAVEGIEAFVAADDAGGAYPPLQALEGVRLLVYPEEAERARQILQAWRSTAAEPGKGPTED